MQQLVASYVTIKKETSKTIPKGELEKDFGAAAATVQTGARVVVNMLSDSYSGLKVEYKKEKLKQK
jgi:hypothetical protein